MVSVPVQGVRTALPLLSDFLEIDEFMQLSLLLWEMKDAARCCVLGNPYKNMLFQQYQNALLASSLFVTACDTLLVNRCGLLDCQKLCGLWLPSIPRDTNGRYLQIHPAPSSDPQILVAEYLERNPGRHIVTCSLTCCLKAWSMLRIVQAAHSYTSPRRRQYAGVLYTTSKAALRHEARYNLYGFYY